jgi:hypothetical protein
VVVPGGAGQRRSLVVLSDGATARKAEGNDIGNDGSSNATPGTLDGDRAGKLDGDGGTTSDGTPRYWN